MRTFTRDRELMFRRRWATLAVLCLSLMVIGLDNTILNVALPTLGRDLHASTSSLQWIVDVYVLVFAGLLLSAGSLGDRFGRYKTLAIGLAVFGLGSLASALAGSTAQLIATRAFMGIGGAFIMPSTLSIITNVFTNPVERGKAIGIWAGVAALGIGVGPVAGGFLLTHFYWGSVFFVNLPIVAVALVGGWFLVPDSKDPSAPSRRHPHPASRGPDGRRLLLGLPGAALREQAGRRVRPGGGGVGAGRLHRLVGDVSRLADHCGQRRHGGGDGQRDGARDRLDHGLAAPGEGGCRFGHERHHPPDGRRYRGGGPRFHSGVEVPEPHVGRGPFPPPVGVGHTGHQVRHRLRPAVCPHPPRCAERGHDQLPGPPQLRRVLPPGGPGRRRGAVAGGLRRVRLAPRAGVRRSPSPANGRAAGSSRRCAGRPAGRRRRGRQRRSAAPARRRPSTRFRGRAALKQRPAGPARRGLPSPWITRLASLVAPSGAILDVACGGGRHAVVFLEQGRSVVVVDRDLSGVADLLGHPLVEAVEADLEDGRPFPLLGRQFAGVVCTNYLHRPVLPALIWAVAPGGALLYETFMEGQEQFGRPWRPEFLLRPGELAAAVAGQLEIRAYEEVLLHRPGPAMVQRIAAVRPA